MVTLTVDDNVLITQTLVRILASVDPAGTHLVAASGAEALDIARSRRADVAFLDVEMPDMSGLEVARQLAQLQPSCDVVFVTGHGEYALQAFGLYASAYLLKPVREAQVREALGHLRHGPDPAGGEKAIGAMPKARGGQQGQAQPIQAGPAQAGPIRASHRLRVQCFGFFEVWYDGEPVHFRRARTKALMAFLIDRNGAMCSTAQLVDALWPEAAGDSSHANQLRVFTSDLQTTLTRLGQGDVLVRTHGNMGINKSLVSCDYYDYLAGDDDAARRFHGEYMSQYSFGEPTLAALTRTLNWRA